MQQEYNNTEEKYSQGRRMMDYMNLTDTLSQEQKKQLEELRLLVPEGTPTSKLQGIIISCKGDKTKLSIMVEDLWNSADSVDDGWEEIPDKVKSKKYRSNESPSTDGKPYKSTQTVTEEKKSTKSSYKSNYSNSYQNKTVHPSSKYQPSKKSTTYKKYDKSNPNSNNSSLKPQLHPRSNKPSYSNKPIVTQDETPIQEPTSTPASEPTATTTNSIQMKTTVVKGREVKVMDWSRCLKKEVNESAVETVKEEPQPSLNLTPRRTTEKIPLNLQPHSHTPHSTQEPVQTQESTDSSSRRELSPEENLSLQPQHGQSPLLSPTTTYQSQSSSIASTSTENTNKQKKSLPFSLGAFGIPENSSSITFGTTEDIKSSQPDHSITSSPATPTTPVSTSQVPVMNYYDSYYPYSAYAPVYDYSSMTLPQQLSPSSPSTENQTTTDGKPIDSSIPSQYYPYAYPMSSYYPTSYAMYGNEYDYNAYGAYPQYYQSYSYPTYTQPKPQGEEKKGDNEGKK